MTAKTLTAEHKAKISAARKGQKLSDEHKAKIAAAHKGLKQTPEHISKAAGTRVGKHKSSECKAKLSEKAKNRAHPEIHSPEANTKRAAKLKEIQNTPEYKARRSEISKKLWSDPLRRAKMAVSVRAAHVRGAYDNSLTCRAFVPSNLEWSVADALDKLDVMYVQQYRLPGYARVYDFYISDQNLLVEVDGMYWHSLYDAKCVDAEKDYVAVMRGFRILRIKEEDMESMGVLEIVQQTVCCDE